MSTNQSFLNKTLNYLFFLFSILIFNLILFLGATNASDETENSFQIHKIFIKKGLSSDHLNDGDSELVVEGDFPNFCYKNFTSEVTVRHEEGTILLKLKPQMDSNSRCLQSIRSFIHTTKLGATLKKTYSLTISVDGPIYNTVQLYTSEKGWTPDENTSGDNKSLSLILIYHEAAEVFTKDFGFYITRAAIGGSSFIFDGYLISDCYEVSNFSYEYNLKDKRLYLYPEIVQKYQFCPRKMVLSSFRWDKIPLSLTKILSEGSPVTIEVKSGYEKNFIFIY